MIEDLMKFSFCVAIKSMTGRHSGQWFKGPNGFTLSCRLGWSVCSIQFNEKEFTLLISSWHFSKLKSHGLSRWTYGPRMYVYVYVCVSMYTYIHACARAHTHIYVYVYVYVFMYVYVYVYIQTHIYVYVYVCVCVCVSPPFIIFLFFF